jgi:hypothetical protein
MPRTARVYLSSGTGRCYRCGWPRHQHPRNIFKAWRRWVAQHPGIVRETDACAAECCLVFKEEPEGIAGGAPREGYRKGEGAYSGR